MRNFRDYDVWKRTIQFIKRIYLFTEKLPYKEKFNIISQVESAAVSISSNIAEGSARSSEKDFARFIEFALGSAFETENLLIIAKEVGYIQEAHFISMVEELQIIQKMLNSLYSKLKGK